MAISVTLLLNYIQLIKSLHNYCDQLQTKKSGLTEIYSHILFWPKDIRNSSDNQVCFLHGLLLALLSSERSAYMAMAPLVAC